MSRARRKPISRAIEIPRPTRGGAGGGPGPDLSSKFDDEITANRSDLHDTGVHGETDDDETAEAYDEEDEEASDQDEDTAEAYDEDDEQAYDEDDEQAYDEDEDTAEAYDEDDEQAYDEDEDTAEAYDEEDEQAYDEDEETAEAYDEDAETDETDEAYDETDEADDEDAEAYDEDTDEAYEEDADETDEAYGGEESYDDYDYDEDEEDEPSARRAVSRPARRSRTAATGRDAAPLEDPSTIKPYRMQPPEPAVGYLVAAVLLAVSCVRLPGIISGHHSNYLTGFILGLLASALLVVSAWRKLRFAGVVAALLGGSLAAPPKNFKPTWLPELTVAVAFIYGFWMILHLSKAQRALRLAKGLPAGRGQRGQPRDRSNRPPAGRRGAAAPAPKVAASGRALPSANRRYTPPKSKSRRR